MKSRKGDRFQPKVVMVIVFWSLPYGSALLSLPDLVPTRSSRYGRNPTLQSQPKPKNTNQSKETDQRAECKHCFTGSCWTYQNILEPIEGKQDTSLSTTCCVGRDASRPDGPMKNRRFWFGSSSAVRPVTIVALLLPRFGITSEPIHDNTSLAALTM